MEAWTFGTDGDGPVKVEIVSGPTSTGLFKVKGPDGKKFVRHHERLSPADDESRELFSQFSK